jgi:hypothetical protein
VTPEEATYLVNEIHLGIRGIHAGPRMVVAKILNARYYWPDMHGDAVRELQKCRACQQHAPVDHRPKNDLVLVTSAWPFQKWGIDIVGPFPKAPGRIKFLLVAIDYFTKWIEAKPLATITGRMSNGSYGSILSVDSVFHCIWLVTMENNSVITQ